MILKKLPTFWSEKDGRLQELGIDAPEEIRPGWVHVNPEYIVAVNESINNESTIRMAGGDAYRIAMNIKELLKIL